MTRQLRSRVCSTLICHSFAVALALSVSFELQAQGVLPRRDTLAFRLYPIAARSRVRLRTTEGERIEGRLAQSSHMTAGLRLEGRSDPLAFALVDSLWVRESARAKGAAIGGLALGISSLAFWGALCQGLSEGAGCGEWGTVIALSLPEAALGAVIGGLVGSRLVRWRLRYARRL
jgi:hypothetical protein